MQWMRQTHNTCGQTCLAMLAKVSLETAISAVGVGGKTCTKDLVNGLRQLKVGSGKRLERLRRADKLPRYCIVKVYHSYGSHWVLHWDGTVYDSELGIFSLSDFKALPLQRLTSYLVVVPPIVVPLGNRHKKAIAA